MYNPIETFLQEAEDLLIEIETAVLEMNSGDTSSEITNQLFRAFHTIKGSGVMFGFDQVADFTHHVETTLDAVRSGMTAPTPQLASLILSAKDHIKVLLAAGQSGNPVALDSGHKLIEDFKAFSNTAPYNPNPGKSDPILQDTAEEICWEIDFHPAPNLLSCGGNPVLLFRDLAKLAPARYADM